MAVRDEHKDLSVLKAMGLRYGDVLSARALYQRLFASVPTMTSICLFTAHPDEKPPSYDWRSGCSSINSARSEVFYAVARRDGMGIPGLAAPGA